MPFFSGRCYSTARLDGKTAVITGCNTGIGKETVMDLYKRGAKVIMACRNLEKAEEAKTSIERTCEMSYDTGKIEIIQCDLSSLRSVRECATKLLDTEPQINILINNAAVMMCPKGETEDGFETHIGTNHLAHFLFTLLLLPRIRNSTPARIVTVSAKAHERTKFDLEDLHYKNREYGRMEAYGQSKVANILFSKELSSKLQEYNIKGINTYSLHPGLVDTRLGRAIDDILFPGALTIINMIIAPVVKSPELGAQTTIYCAVDEKCANESGLYYSDCVVVDPSLPTNAGEVSKKLWDISSDLVGLGDYNPFTATDCGVKNTAATQ